MNIFLNKQPCHITKSFLDSKKEYIYLVYNRKYNSIHSTNTIIVYISKNKFMFSKICKNTNNSGNYYNKTKVFNYYDSAYLTTVFI